MHSIAEKIGCTTEALRARILRADGQADPRRNKALAVPKPVTHLERENAELRRANDIWRKASAFFAQTKLDRRGK